MLQFENQKIKQIVRKVLPVVTLVVMLYSCASIGRPDGGPIDETPPRFVGSTPAAGALNNKRTKVSLVFDEFIKLEKATEKVVVSPPQIQQPEIKASGKRIQVNLLDSLKPNTTYTIDFSDAIVDNNEGNPLVISLLPFLRVRKSIRWKLQELCLMLLIWNRLKVCLSGYIPT